MQYIRRAETVTRLCRSYTSAENVSIAASRIMSKCLEHGRNAPEEMMPQLTRASVVETRLER